MIYDDEEEEENSLINEEGKYMIYDLTKPGEMIKLTSNLENPTRKIKHVLETDNVIIRGKIDKIKKVFLSGYKIYFRVYDNDVLTFIIIKTRNKKLVRKLDINKEMLMEGKLKYNHDVECFYLYK